MGGSQSTSGSSDGTRNVAIETEDGEVDVKVIIIEAKKNNKEIKNGSMIKLWVWSIVCFYSY